MFTQSNQKGFTLIEVLVVAAIIGVLAGILVPLIFDRVEEAKISRAEADIKNIASAILLFHKDTGTWPYCNTNGAPTQYFERLDSSNSTDPGYSGANWPNGQTDTFYNHLTSNTRNYTSWNGPYIETVEEDPWGNEYRLWARGFSNANEHAWVVSAGPNGDIETDETATTPGGDDLAIMLR
jgi:general secretion pathway protein G